MPRPAPRTRALRTIAALAVTAVLAALPTPTQATPEAAAATPADYCAGQCRDILPPGQNGNATFADILAFKAFGIRPAHSDDQLEAVRRTWSGNYAGITDDGLAPYFNDSSFGVPTGPCREHDPAARGRDDRAGQGDRRPAHHRHHPAGR